MGQPLSASQTVKSLEGLFTLCEPEEVEEVIELCLADQNLSGSLTDEQRETAQVLREALLEITTHYAGG